jgi:hypothetical protein
MPKPHVKWITIVGVVLMLLALFVYLATLDEADPDEIPQVIEQTR